MRLVRLKKAGDFEAWRADARSLLLDQIPPDGVEWRSTDEGETLFGDSESGRETSGTGRTGGIAPPSPSSLSMPRALVEMADRIICHRDADVPAKLYRLFWRAHADPQLLSRKTDADVHWAQQIDKDIRRDIHKMHAFVRFRRIGENAEGREGFAAWFEPSHLTLRLGAPFFQRRFPNMDWAIITPDERAIWNGEALIFGDGGSRSEVPETDQVEDQWRTYYGAIFNPARVKIKAMRAEMPKKYWHNLPEAQDIPTLLASADQRVEHMRATSITSPNARAEKWQQNVIAAREGEAFVGDNISDLPALARALDHCRLCELYCSATQAVAGEGPEDARIMIVGEQPGDQEDLAGRPFIGPAGQLLDVALERSGFDRTKIFVTNAVKHFKFAPRGKRRLHQRPTAGEIDMCRWWLNKERELVQPDWIITLGASALRAVAGPKATLADMRGQPMQSEDGTKFLATVHPSYLLRIGDRGSAAQEKQAFLRDLRLARELVG